MSSGKGAAVIEENLHRVRAVELTRFAAGVLTAWGMTPERAQGTADLIVESDLRGIDSHGVAMLAQYERLVSDGRADLSAEPVLVRSTGAAGLVDAGDGLGHLAMKFAMESAITAAAELGVAAVGVHRSHHFGAAGVYATMASDRGMVGLVATTTRTRSVVPTRGTEAVLGTNPLAFAAPTEDSSAPFVLDMSTSTVAVNKVRTYDHLGVDVPAGWVVDGSGESVTDVATAHRQVRAQSGGGLTPLGGSEATSGYKGYGLGLMVQVLAGALVGATFAPHRPSTQVPDDIGHFCLVVDPKAFGNGELGASVSAIVDELRAQRPIEPARPVLVPGDPERAARVERLAHGVPMADALFTALQELGVRAGTDPLQPMREAARAAVANAGSEG